MQPVAPVGKPLRLFIALWPDEALRNAMASWRRRWAWPPRAALVERERLHLTLHFLGDVAADRLPELVRALRVPCEPFELTLGEAQVWPGGLAVLELHGAAPPLLLLHAALGRKLAGLDLPLDERPYRAHVTLARRAQGALPPPEHTAFPWRVDSGYVLVRSLPNGAGYEVLERFS